MKAYCPKCQNEVAYETNDKNDNPCLADDFYYFFICDECGAEFTLKTEIEIYPTQPQEYERE